MGGKNEREKERKKKTRNYKWSSNKQIVQATTQNWKCIQEENELEWELQTKELSFPYERKHFFFQLFLSFFYVLVREIKERKMKKLGWKIKQDTNHTLI